LQVGLALVGAGFVIGAAVRRFAAGDVLLVAFLAELAVAEVDLDRRVFGIAVIDSKFLLGTGAPLSHRVLAGAVIVGTVTALLGYAIWKWREILGEALDGLRAVWGPLLVVALVLLAIPQPCERCLNVGPFPDYFLEETLELLGTLYVVLAMVGRASCRWQAVAARAAAPASRDVLGRPGARPPLRGPS
jgi:hypothetical protein